MKIGLVAGQGQLPHCVIESAAGKHHDIFVAAIDGFSHTSDFSVEGQNFGLAEFGKITKMFKSHDCTHVCFAGNIKRPDFKQLKPDLKGLRRLPGAIKAARDGDNSLLKYVLKIFEKEGFEIISPQTLCEDLLLPVGKLGELSLGVKHREDAEKACRIASEIGALDIGQAAIVCRGLVLAVEAQEGTDAMIERVGNLPEGIRGSVFEREGVLAKMIKPAQEIRVDMPTIGPKTIELVAKAGLAGIVAEAGRAFILDRDAVIAQANQAGIFIAGLPPSGS